MRKVSTKIGNIIIWSDFVRSKKIPSTGNIVYYQSNTKLEGYGQRYIGILVTHSNDVYVGVALNSKKDDKGPWYKFIIENRIQNVMSGYGLEEKGGTMVPIAYLDLLYKDPTAYSSLYGAIEPTMLDIAMAMAREANEQAIDEYSNRPSKGT